MEAITSQHATLQTALHETHLPFSAAETAQMQTPKTQPALLFTASKLARQAKNTELTFPQKLHS